MTGLRMHLKRCYARKFYPLTKYKTDMKPSQNDLIKAHLLSGRTITPLEALSHYNCFSLAQRIKNLKDQGLKIETRTKVLANKKRVAEYQITESE